MTAQQFQKLLLAWFDKHGRQHLPWQQNKTPYRVWVSEIMLQQTQVNTVIPYYERFMKQFPDLLSLANAREDEVLHLWSGLGYYSRARHLQRTAKIIVEQYQGIFPNTLDELQTLPGIGRSTAGAILSIAFNQPTAILDGNVKRVLARFHGITDPINEKTGENKLWHFAKHYTPAKRVADYTQAMMDLGATLCTRAKPACERCPFHSFCEAYIKNSVEKIPKKKSKKVLPERDVTFIIFKKDKEFLLQKRPSYGIWSGLWSFPEIAGKPEKKSIHSLCRQHFQTVISHYRLLDSFRHTFSHYHLDIFPVVIEVKKVPMKIMEDTQKIWYKLNQPEAIGLAKPIQFILEQLL